MTANPPAVAALALVPYRPAAKLACSLPRLHIYRAVSRLKHAASKQV